MNIRCPRCDAAWSVNAAGKYQCSCGKDFYVLDDGRVCGEEDVFAENLPPFDGGADDKFGRRIFRLIAAAVLVLICINLLGWIIWISKTRPASPPVETIGAIVSAETPEEKKTAAAAAPKQQPDEKHAAKTPPPASAKTADIEFRNNRATVVFGDVKLEMSKIEAGRFFMGSRYNELGRTSDEAIVPITVDDDFWIGRYEVTQRQYFAITGQNPSAAKHDRHPVEWITAEEAVGFCDKLNELFESKLPAGYKFRLPTEMQWEFACRAGTTSAFNNDVHVTTGTPLTFLDDLCWYDGNSGGRHHPAGEKGCNANALYDMHGNVAELCRIRKGVRRPVGIGYTAKDEDGEYICRGGSYNVGAAGCRSASRRSYKGRSCDLGFRLALCRQGGGGRADKRDAHDRPTAEKTGPAATPAATGKTVASIDRPRETGSFLAAVSDAENRNLLGNAKILKQNHDQARGDQIDGRKKASLSLVDSGRVLRMNCADNRNNHLYIPAPLKPGKTYVFSFSYRTSDIPKISISCSFSSSGDLHSSSSSRSLNADGDRHVSAMFIRVKPKMGISSLLSLEVAHKGSVDLSNVKIVEIGEAVLKPPVPFSRRMDNAGLAPSPADVGRNRDDADSLILEFALSTGAVFKVENGTLAVRALDDAPDIGIHPDIKALWPDLYFGQSGCRAGKTFWNIGNKLKLPGGANRIVGVELLDTNDVSRQAYVNGGNMHFPGMSSWANTIIHTDSAVYVPRSTTAGPVRYKLKIRFAGENGNAGRSRRESASGTIRVRGHLDQYTELLFFNDRVIMPNAPHSSPQQHGKRDQRPYVKIDGRTWKNFRKPFLLHRNFDFATASLPSNVNANFRGDSLAVNVSGDFMFSLTAARKSQLDILPACYWAMDGDVYYPLGRDIIYRHDDEMGGQVGYSSVKGFMLRPRNWRGFYERRGRPISIACAVKVIQTGGRGKCALLGCGNYNNAGWFLALELECDSGKVTLTNGINHIRFPRAINDGKWHYIAGVADGAYSFICVDGVFERSDSAIFDQLSIDNHSAFVNQARGAGGTEMMIAEVQLYDNSLPLQKIITDFKNFKNVLSARRQGR